MPPRTRRFRCPCHPSINAAVGISCASPISEPWSGLPWRNTLILRNSSSMRRTCSPSLLSWFMTIQLAVAIRGHDHLRGDLAPPTGQDTPHAAVAPPSAGNKLSLLATPQHFRGRAEADTQVPETDVGGKRCRSAFIRPHLVVDDEGYVCDRKSGFDRRASQCCVARTPANKHTCRECDADSGCCREYEHCVSCCLEASNQATLQPGDVWEQCVDRCRTGSKTIEGVWNGYRTDLKHCYGNGAPPDYSSQDTQTSMEDITVVKAKGPGQSCREACQAKGKTCVVAGFHHMNKCDVLKQHFDCKECKEDVGPEQPAFVVPEAPASFPRNKCLYTRNPRGITCEASHKATQRLCPCQ